LPFQGQHYPPETLAIMSQVLDDCVANVINGHPADRETIDGIRFRLAQVILGAVAGGVDDPLQLKQIALKDFMAKP
jgi:hypothetical protein